MTDDAPEGGEERVLPCPFCGCAELHAFEHDDGQPSFGFQCTGCWMTSSHHDTKQEALAAWNRRTPAPQPGLEAERMQPQKIRARRMKEREPIGRNWMGTPESAQSLADSLERYARIRPSEGRLIWAMEESAMALLKQDAIITELRALAAPAPAQPEAMGEVTIPRDIAEQIHQKLLVVARAFQGDKQTRETLIPAVANALAARRDREQGR